MIALREAARRLAAAGVESPVRNAELLLAHALGKDRAWLLAHPEAEPPPAFEDLLRRREAREPLEYLTGSAAFAGIVLHCDRRALIPRPETEDLVELAAARAPSRIADVGTGTGALALALKARLPDAEIVATDVSKEALALAKENARRLDLDVEFRQGPDLDPLDGAFDAVVGNPPYIPESEIPGLQPEVRDWEPRAALAGGAGGTEVFARWAAAVPGRLVPGGWTAFELGIGQAGKGLELLRAAGLRDGRIHRDFRGADRFVSARR